MLIYQDLLKRKEKLAVIGLGYVGLPLALEFSKHVDVIGFDINEAKINSYKNYIDPTKEMGAQILQETSCFFTSNSEDLKKAKFFIVTVPTPIDSYNQPDFSCLISASCLVGQALQQGSIVVYESTVFPGATQEICIPTLEQSSGLSCLTDFKVGYSPERINPTDKQHRLDTIVKIVSGIDEQSLQEIGEIYKLVVNDNIHYAPSIQVAEAAKIAENSQRDINIAFMNELAMTFDAMGIDTKSVLDAMKTKWNALAFSPGLVGGHCISVDPYYFIYKSQQMGVYSKLHAISREINESIPQFIVDKILKLMIQNNMDIHNASIALMGITYKENCPDVRNSKAITIVQKLKSYGITVSIYDPIVDEQELQQTFGISLSHNYEKLVQHDAIIIAVMHDEFLQYQQQIKNYGSTSLVIDVKNHFHELFQENDKASLYWRL